MVGLVLVSHSRALAEALMELVKQVSAQEIPLAAAAGVGEKRQEFGTDATEIAEAIQQVYSPEGVLVLMDLGSAILSAEMAMELLPPDMQLQIRFCEAPLVEGAISAGVQISLRQELETVFQEARQALRPKIKHLADSHAAPESNGDERERSLLTQDARDEWHNVVLTIMTEHGLHARPAARFVQTSAQFDADIRIYPFEASTPDRGRSSAVSAKSLSRLMTLGVLRGEQLVVMACGREARQALDALRHLVEDNFGEKSNETEAALPGAAQELNVLKKERAIIPLSGGIAIGPAFYYRASLEDIPEHLADRPEREWEELQQALTAIRDTIEKRCQSTRENMGEAQAAIFEAHLLILDDRVLLERTQGYLFEQRLNAASAWGKSVRELADSYRALTNSYLQQRANDVIDVGNQVLSVLSGQQTELHATLSTQGILIVEELTPSFVAQLDPTRVLGLIAKRGGPTDHSSILARSLGIPAIVVPWLSLPGQNVPEQTTAHERLHISPGVSLALDAFTGELWLDTPSDVVEELQQRRTAWHTRQVKLLEKSGGSAITSDGHAVTIAANAASELDAGIAARYGAEAIGVLRTEFLYVTRSTAPSELEQTEVLLRIGQLMKGRPVYVRTLDIGGDKAVPYIKLPHETNPFLGLRSIRLSLQRPGIFLTQLRAILRAAAQSDIRLMFPMICRKEDLLKALACLERAHQTLEQAQIPHQWPIRITMMVETPAAVLQISSFVEHVELFSIGTNDLTQYTMAAERGHPELAEYADGLHPAILRLIQQTVDAAHQHGKHVAVCGELASDPSAVSVLIGLGVDELSLNPGSIPEIKATIRGIDREAAVRLAQRALQAESAEEVRKLAATIRLGNILPGRRA
ncbi:MAG: phosphoenolpyruvate--protein phosphotransferase [bacterium]|nr:phosphoenolpyruvate--protein phosphotransferase [bacterium]